MQHLGIIGHHGAIIAVFRALLANIIGHAGIKNVVHALVEQPFDMPMHQLSGIANSVAGNGVLPQAINALILDGTSHNLKAQMIEQPLPKGQQLVHIEAHGNAHKATLRRFVIGQSLEQFQLLAIKVQIILGCHMGNGAFAAITADKALAAGKNVDG